MIILNIHEAKTNLSKLLVEVAKGKEIIIAKAGNPIAKLVPYEVDPILQKKSNILNIGAKYKGVNPKKPIDLTHIRDAIDYSNW